MFLIYKATHEIHDRLEGEEGHVSARVAPTFAAVIGQIMLLDIVFSLDSVITAVGMADDLSIMIAAVVIAVAIMMFSAGAVSGFVERHPTVKVLALSFLLLIGCSLIADGFGVHIPKGYIYFAMGFSVFVEAINLRSRAKSKAKPVKLHEPIQVTTGSTARQATSGQAAPGSTPPPRPGWWCGPRPGRGRSTSTPQTSDRRSRPTGS